MTDTSPAWDLFISHASEDKDLFVRPLATELSRLGLRVWYDEFTLQLGDSISESIDRGLADSSSGLVIISRSFIAKPWPRRELAGLVAGQIGRKQLVIPVWLDVSFDEVLAFSPPLADRKAIIATETALPDVALRILERVRPELHSAYQRRLAFEHWLEETEGEVMEVRAGDIDLEGPIRNDVLPIDMVYALRVIREALLEVFSVDWRTTVDNFRKDMRPDAELFNWLHIAGVYLTVLNEFDLNPQERKQLFIRVMRSSFGQDQQVPDDSPAWERRAFELSTYEGDPTEDRFASGSA